MQGPVSCLHGFMKKQSGENCFSDPQAENERFLLDFGKGFC